MTHGDDSKVDRHRVDAFASEDEPTIQEFLQARPTVPARPTERRRSALSLYQRIGCAGGLLWLVNTLYLRVLADPVLMSYFKHLDDQDRQWLRWHMLTLLAVVTGGPTKYEGRDLHQAHADLHITEDAFDRVVGHLQATLQELEAQQEDQQAILAAVQARRDAVVTFEQSSETARLPRARDICARCSLGGQGMPPPKGRNLGHALLGARPAGRWAVPGAQARTHPAHRPRKERQRRCRRYGPATKHPNREAGQERPGYLRFGPAPTNAQRWKRQLRAVRR